MPPPPLTQPTQQASISAATSITNTQISNSFSNSSYSNFPPKDVNCATVTNVGEGNATDVCAAALQSVNMMNNSGPLKDTQDSSMIPATSSAASSLTAAMLQHLWSSMAAATVAAASKQQEKFLNT